MYKSKHVKNDRSKGRNFKAGTLLISVLLLVAVVAGGTIAYLFTQTDAITNTFNPSHVSCEVTESFNGEVKSNVNVTNTSDIDAYIRVKLVTYRVNDSGQHIGGVASVPDFPLGEGWIQFGDYYYYTSPVKPGKEPTADLISAITLAESYDDADGGKQVIEVMAEAIQSVPAKAVCDAWGVTVGNDGKISVKEGV